MSSVLNETMCPATKIIDRRLSSTLVKTMTIKTCVGIYNDHMKQWRPDFYRYATIDGIELTINYVDTLIVNNDDDNLFVVAGINLPFNRLLLFRFFIAAIVVGIRDDDVVGVLVGVILDILSFSID